MITVFFISCAENTELKNLEKKSEELKCKADFGMFLLDNSMNIQVLLKQKGFEKELDEFMKMQNDTTVSCEQLKNKWTELSDKATK